MSVMGSPHAARRLADIGADAVLIAGGGRAVMLQIANPAIGHAVARHSDFAAQPLRRLKHTLTFVYALVYGTPSQIAAVRTMVDRAHAAVRSTASTSPSYDARDPELQLWVAATLYDTAVTVRQRLVGPLDEADLDAIYQDYAAIGLALQVPEGMWPRDRSAFAIYWEAQAGLLEVDDRVRGVARDLLHPKVGPIWLRAGMPLARLVTAGLLTPQLRAAFDLPWSVRRERRFERAMSLIARVNRILPRRMREWPRNRMLRKLG